MLMDGKDFSRQKGLKKCGIDAVQGLGRPRLHSDRTGRWDYNIGVARQRRVQQSQAAAASADEMGGRNKNTSSNSVVAEQPSTLNQPFDFGLHRL
jgi:hypothetical protein